MNTTDFPVRFPRKSKNSIVVINANRELCFRHYAKCVSRKYELLSSK